MPATRRRRIVRRAVMGLAAVVLLVLSYPSAWIVMPRLAKVTGSPYLAQINSSLLFRPIWTYIQEQRPGSAVLMNLYLRVNARQVGPDTWVFDTN